MPDFALRFRLLFLAAPLCAAAAIIAVPFPAAAQSNAPSIPFPFERLFSKTLPSEPVEGLSAELMYRLLVADIALQRGEAALAARAYYESARETQNITLARRATEIGIAARQTALAL